MKIDPKKADIKAVLAEKFTFAKKCGVMVAVGAATMVYGASKEHKVVRADSDGAPMNDVVLNFADVAGILLAGAGGAGLMLHGLSKAPKKNETNLLDHMPKGMSR